jgi:hypothetical protein
MLTAEKKARIAEKWKYFSERKGRKEDAFRFELDGEETVILSILWWKVRLVY